MLVGAGRGQAGHAAMGMFAPPGLWLRERLLGPHFLARATRFLRCGDAGRPGRRSLRAEARRRPRAGPIPILNCFPLFEMGSWRGWARPVAERRSLAAAGLALGLALGLAPLGIPSSRPSCRGSCRGPPALPVLLFHLHPPSFLLFLPGRTLRCHPGDQVSSPGASPGHSGPLGAGERRRHADPHVGPRETLFRVAVVTWIPR